MGCGPSKNDLGVVQDATGMSCKDAKSSYKSFKNEAGGDKIKLDKFTKLVSSMNTNKAGDVTEYSKHLFRVLDTDRDDKVSWKEVMIGFHHLSANGDKDEKLKLVYKMYDVNGKKAVSADDVKTITRALHRLQGKPVAEHEVMERVKSFFSQCDLNSDGKITEEEFLKAGESVAEMFELTEE